MKENQIEVFHLAGEHGAGKTELAKWLLNKNQLNYIDTGPLTREEYKKRPESLASLDIGSFVEAVKKNDPYYFARDLVQRIKNEKDDRGMVVVGMRNYAAIDDLKTVCLEINNHIIWVESDNEETLRTRVNFRDKKYYSVDEFRSKLEFDNSLGLIEIRQRAEHFIYNPANQTPEELYLKGIKIIQKIK